MSETQKSASSPKEQQDFYVILGVEKSATESQIKNSYRKLALKFHPDRNPGDQAVAEKFKEISVAYAVLSDPNKRRQYDLAGPSGAVVDFEGIDVDQLGGIGRVFGALFTKLGVPIPTQISPKVLGTAKDIIDCRGDHAATSAPSVEDIKHGQIIHGRVERQEAKFYRLKLSPDDCRKGVVIICRSPAMSKFKMILFDKEGGVRQIEESMKRGKQYTAAEMYFVPFNHMQINELFPLKFFTADEKDVPPAFHFLDTLENGQNLQLEPREHLLAVYGDNWLQDVKFQLHSLVAESDSPSVISIQDSEKKLAVKKQELAQFQSEFMEIKRKFEAACERLEMDTKDIVELLQRREKSYEEFLTVSGAKYINNNSNALEQEGGGGLFKGLFSSVSSVLGAGGSK